MTSAPTASARNHLELEQALRDRDRELARFRQYRTHWPLHVRCDTDGCDAAIAWSPAPEEAQVVKALLESGWSCDGTLHRCPRHRT